MRSGSSVTGEILQYSKGTFYVFEPLRVLFNYIIKNNHPLRFVNGTVLRPGSYNSTDVLKEALKGWFTCNFSTIYQLSFKDYVFLNLSSKARNFVSCLNTDGVHKSVLFADCLEKFEKICRESKFVVVKTIRTSMKVAQELMEFIPNLKVIHLVRDARQTAMSQARREGCGLKGIVNCAKSLCKVATEDDEVKTAMEKRHRVLTVRYEEVATMPVNATRAMYNFVGLAFTKEVESYVTRITTGGNHSECETCKLKWQMGNSSQSSVVHIDTWKKEMRPSVIVSVQLLCEKYLTRYGYKLFK
ncbi:hypothetical protein DPMN_129951 [Dreissena polymorpha]|uniref:Sulfotransferase n=2 Tax=Dreissena polymorpha TaxID=45954 RepID=A0A9D4K1F5_DREPO|nr:hypothetical protein DPMN_129951 [Dreissena polymorpha]